MATLIMAAPCPRLVLAPPDRPLKRALRRWWQRPGERDQQPAHLWHRQRQQFHLKVQAPPFWAVPPTACARVTVRNACASNAKVMCRYHPVHLRTSYWSNPTSPLAVSRLSSSAQRVPATATTCSSIVAAGAHAR